MFPRCSGLLSVLKPTPRSPGCVPVSLSTRGLNDVTVTARALQRHRLLSWALADRHRALPAASAARGCSPRWVPTVTVGLSRGAGRGPVALQGTAGRHQRGAVGLFTARISMQTRSSSSAARSDASTKAEVEPMKEVSAPPSSCSETASGDKAPEGGKPNKKEQLKKVFKEYGAVGVSFHIGMSLMSLGMFYLLVSSGIDMAAILCKLGFSEAVVRSKMAAGTSTFVLAYAIHKLFVPVRISITLVSVPLIVRYLRKTGLFKPPTPAQ